MWECWLKFRWSATENKLSSSDDMDEFVDFLDGPQTRRMAQRFPASELEKRLQEGPSEHVATVIRNELARRSFTRPQIGTLAIAGLSLIVSAAAFLRTL